VIEEPLRFQRMLGGYVAENHHRYYAIFSGWGYYRSLKKCNFVWTLEVREKSEVTGLRTIVGSPVIYEFRASTRAKVVEEAQRFERSIVEALELGRSAS